MTTSNDANKSKDSTKPEQNKPAPRKVPNIFSKTIPFIVVIAVSVSVAVFYTKQQLSKQAHQFVTETQALHDQQSDNKAQVETELTTIDQSEKHLNDRLVTLNKTLESALQERWYQSSDWLMLKARYYLELAAISAHWSENLQTTSALLKEADGILATIPGERLFSVREAIAKEEMDIAQIPMIDTEGILARLDATQHILNTLAPQKLLVASERTAAKELTTPKTWRDRLKASLKQLDNLIIIRHQDDAIKPLLTPAYETMLRENIHLNLQEAQWSVLQKNPVIYELSLTQAIENINRVFDTNDAQTKAVVKQLDTLRSVKLTQPKPVLGQSLQLLNQFIDTKTNEIKPAKQGDQS